MAKKQRERVRKAIESIKKIHALGRESLREHGREREPGAPKKQVEAEAERRGMHPDTLRKARQVADPETGYTQGELQNLCRLIRAHQDAADPRLPVFGRAHIMRSVSIPRKQRAALEEMAIKASWNSERLEIEITRLYGTRSPGGRRPHIPNNVEAAMAQLEGQCKRWRRWASELDRGQRVQRVTRADLPRAVLQRLDVATAALHDLQLHVTKELRGQHPERDGRDISPVEANKEAEVSRRPQKVEK